MKYVASVLSVAGFRWKLNQVRNIMQNGVRGTSQGNIFPGLVFWLVGWNRNRKCCRVRACTHACIQYAVGMKKGALSIDPPSITQSTLHDQLVQPYRGLILKGLSLAMERTSPNDVNVELAVTATAMRVPLVSIGKRE